MVRALAGLAAVAVVAVVVLSGSDDGVEAQTCGLEPFSFDTYEVFDNAGLYLAAIELAAAGEVITSATTPSGAPHELEYPGLLRGTRAQRLEGEPDPTVRIPPKLMKAIVWVETGFAQAHSDVPWGGVGRVVRSPDCGFGLGQITSGMENETGNPTTRQALVGTHFLFNLAEVARMLAQKWNADFAPIAGTGDPAVLEDWYYTLWAYNGLAAVNHPRFETDQEHEWLNHPLHPGLDPLRGEVWHCRDELAPSWVDSGNGRPVYDYGDYTYPERIYGCLRHPPDYPSRLYDDERYTPTFPPEVAEAGPTPSQDEEDTADEGESSEETGEATVEESTDDEDGTSEDVTTDDEEDASVEEDEEGETTTGEEAVVEEWPGGIPRLWHPVHVNMPDMDNPQVAAAFWPNVFITCEERWFPAGCPGMDFPTSFPELGIETHRDLTAPVEASLLDRLLGQPETVITGPDEATIRFDEDGWPGSVEVTVQNVGTWIAPFRIITSNRWILVRRGTGGGRIHGGVAIGVETTVVVYAPENVTKQGHAAVLHITVDRAQLPDGPVQGTVLIEPLLDSGEMKRIVVHVPAREDVTTEPAPAEEGDDGEEEDNSQNEDIVEEEDDSPDEDIVEEGDGNEEGVVEEEEEEATLDHRIVVPGLARDE